MRSVIISSVLLILLIIAISANAYYINSVSTEMLDMVFALPSDYDYIINSDEKDVEKYKTEINKLTEKWENHSFRLNLVTKYSDFERVNTALYSMKEYFFTGYYTDYAVMRKRLISALEKQKQNELPVLENIF